MAADVRRARWAPAHQACVWGCPCWAGIRACYTPIASLWLPHGPSPTVRRRRGAPGRPHSARARREDLLKREMADLVRRGQAAEARHEDLAGALPEATRPLLRQIAALQARAPLGARLRRALRALRRALLRQHAAGA